MVLGGARREDHARALVVRSCAAVSRSVFITGASGAVGAWVARACLERGDRVAVLARGPGGDVDPRCAVVAGDLLDGRAIEHALSTHEADTVFHLAAHVVGVDERRPGPTYETNVGGTWRVMEACRELGVARVVVASSIKAYGPSRARPFREEDPLGGQGVYGVSKAAADAIARSYWAAAGVRVATARLANVYGGGDRNRSRLVPGAIAAVLSGRAPVIRSDGGTRLDLLHAEDAASAYLAIADALDDGDAACGQAFNAGGESHTVLEVVDAIVRLAGGGVRPEITGEVPAAAAALDASRLRDLTGWRPRVGLEEGLRRTLDWYRAHPSALDLS